MKAMINDSTGTVLKDAVNEKIVNNNYFVEAKSWFEEKYEAVEVSRNQYRLLFFCLFVLLALSMTGYIILLPLKQTIYRVIAVNNTTGEIETLQDTNPKQFETNWPVTRYFINQYVINRESYNSDDIIYPYNLALSFTAPELAEQYKKHMHDTDPMSPINVLGKDNFRTVNVLSISKLSDSAALVRFDTVTKNKVSGSVKTEAWNVVIKWRYALLTETTPQRDKNPLGFQVTYYQVNSVIPAT